MINGNFSGALLSLPRPKASLLVRARCAWGRVVGLLQAIRRASPPNPALPVFPLATAPGDEAAFIHCFQIELEFNVVFCGGRKNGVPREKPLEQG